MIRLTLLSVCLALLPQVQASERVVSLDYCADQYALKLLPRDRIVALSPDGTKNFSYLRKQAVGLPTIRPIAEEILLAKPDVVIRSYGGGSGITHFLQRFGIDVIQIGYAGNLASIQRNILDIATGLGQPQQGQAIVDDMAAQLAALKTQHDTPNTPTALYMVPTGYTSGLGTLIDELLLNAGLTNYVQTPGWHPLPLEQLLYKSPQVTVLAFYETLADRTAAWSAMAHPVAQRQLEITQSVPLQGAWTACGGWFVVEAIQAMANAGTGVQAEQAMPHE